MICLCLAYQFFGVLVAPLSWSDSWICIGIPSFIAMRFIRSVVALPSSHKGPRGERGELSLAAIPRLRVRHR